MNTRRDFLKKAALLSGAAGFFSLPASIQQALAINPEAGTTYLDAEHIVFLMQENRSFDHCYGTLQGVRGFNDPRAIKLPNDNLVWLQTNAAGETYAPFRLDIKQTKITWMGSLPHSWTNQVDARNNGKYDKWLHVKQSGQKEYEDMPLTMGHYTREDIPFYYALADAFTVCDQNFCSSLTGTTPNRLYFWTGTIREEQDENSKANVWNEEADHNSMVSWKTFPERLEENGISWKIYQNDLYINGVYTEEQDAWLSNFGDNPIEYFKQFNVKLSSRYINYLQKEAAELPVKIKDLEAKLQSVSGKDLKDLQKEIAARKNLLSRIKEEQAIYTIERYEQLSQHEKNLHEKAFTANTEDPLFYQLMSLQYKDGDVSREINIPKGDIFYQFRKDVKSGNLPTVSWLAAPENFSDHPSSAWFGAWYVSEVLEILTQNPEVWKKTIFILTYDENDGYFDHVPPFVAPNAHDKNTGKTSTAIDTSVDFVTMEQERKKHGTSEEYMRESSIGLGYRVPLVIASPWSRGGFVCSQVFDHTSSLQFLEKFLNHKTGKKIKEENISAWRRTVCGDLTSVFRPYKGDKINAPGFINKDAFIETVHKAKFKKLPSGFKSLTKDEIAEINIDPHSSSYMPKQEKGIRSSCSLPYELYAEGSLNKAEQKFEIRFTAGNTILGKVSSGSPFTVYARNKKLKEFSYAVAAGDQLSDSWLLGDFENEQYHLCVYGPNGFSREFRGNIDDPSLDISCGYEIQLKKATGNVELKIRNTGSKLYKVEIIDNSYKSGIKLIEVNSNQHTSIILNLSKNFGWYDFSVKIKGYDAFEKRYTGHVETGKESKTDPLMGGVV